MWGQDGGVRNQAPLSSFLLDGFIYNTSADVETIRSVAHSLCVISLSLSPRCSVPPKCERLGSGSFSKTQFSKQIHTQVSSIFENKGYHIFPRGLDEGREDAENGGPVHFTWQVS